MRADETIKDYVHANEVRKFELLQLSHYLTILKDEDSTYDLLEAYIKEPHDYQKEAALSLIATVKAMRVLVFKQPVAKEALESYNKGQIDVNELSKQDEQ